VQVEFESEPRSQFDVCIGSVRNRKETKVGKGEGIMLILSPDLSSRASPHIGKRGEAA
jgi:hypothetical protein